jgi:predicted alpha-1,2-mannosidase
MKKAICSIFFFLLINFCTAQTLTKYVDPFLGTGGHGHTYPGATVPFGMVQLSPDNGVEGWDWCSGYHYSSNTIAGFSHTHLSGTGIGDWCDISVMPLSNLDSIKADKAKFPFLHSNEKASPGFYSVTLDNGIKCELTTAERIGFHKYTFPTKEGILQFDMGFAINWDKTTDAMLSLKNNNVLVGYRYSTGWAKGQKIYFAAKLNTEIFDFEVYNDTAKSSTTAYGKKLKGIIKFESKKPVEIQVAISSVSVEQAIKELQNNKNINFDAAKKVAETKWENELSKIKIQSNNKDVLTKFYTALYRTCLAPVVHSDIDRKYQTHDNKIKEFTKGENKYTIFSQWDVFRALSPLFTLTQKERLPDMINSMLQLYDDNGLLPVWDISTWEANTMTGYHSVPIIADAMLKNIKGFDYNKAYTAMLASANQKQRGTQDFIKYGYIPQDKHGWSVTYTLEYAFDDWCIAQVAKKLGKQKDYEIFSKRALAYQKLFDNKTGFMRAKNSDGIFVEPFDPLFSEHGFDGQYVEGTAWQHSFFVPHAVEDLAKLYGGNKKLAEKLDQLFTASSELHGKDVSADISGLIGQYAHGNEPSHHIIYMYTALGYPEKAAKWLKVVTDSMYKTGPNGLIGNDDCGQMSAWYIWTVLGMYPMNPADGKYVFGIPMIEKASIKLPSGKTLEIRVNKIKKPEEAARIYKITFNGKNMPLVSIKHEEILKGGLLVTYVYE